MKLSDIEATAGIRMHGWHHSAEFCQQHLQAGNMLSLCAETTNRCDMNCEYCYTVETTEDTPNFHARALPGELALQQRLDLIDQAAALGAVSYEIVGAGEPLLDACLWPQLERAVGYGMVPIVFTNGSLLGHATRGPELAQKLWGLGATVVVKWHSKNHDIHDRIVRRKGSGKKRDQALQLLQQLGFNATTSTRLGIDNIIYQATINEIPDCLRMCRQQNYHLVCSTFIPSGRTQKGNEEEAGPLDVVRAFTECQRIDEQEFGVVHSSAMPYIGYGAACTQYMGVYVTIRGDMYGCVGQNESESYGTFGTCTLADAWVERLPLLQAYNGGCPPREQGYAARGLVQLRGLFR